MQPKIFENQSKKSHSPKKVEKRWKTLTCSSIEIQIRKTERPKNGWLSSCKTNFRWDAFEVKSATSSIPCAIVFLVAYLLASNFLSMMFSSELDGAISNDFFKRIPHNGNSLGIWYTFFYQISGTNEVCTWGANEVSC